MLVESKIHDLLSRWEAEDGRPSPEELCVDCPELLPQVRDCISRLRSTDRHLDDRAEASPKPPEIPGYEIEPVAIGRGGMGIVWKAVQLGTHRTVALKVISAGEFASQRARARFEREVELASRLNHPKIARVYDSGIHTGQFYYAMELIEGVPLDRYVESEQLNRRQILQLMQPICAAVQHAHQLGVIHRDLKPSNILVDASGQAHLLDFGLAKEVWSESSPQITLEDAPGTPAYMSPEQAAGQYKRVGTTSDVYTLGVILYLLLLKKYPHDVEGTSIEVMQRIATQEPARPRAVDPTFARDLEAILLKALARPPEERYASADALSADIQSWHEGRPITPLRHNWRYVAGKFIRRHKRRLAAAIAMLAIIMSIIVAAYFRVSRERSRAEDAAETASETNRFLDEMLTTRNPETSTGQVPTLLEFVDGAAARIEGAFASRPLVEAAIRNTLGRTYIGLSVPSKAESQLRRALKIRQDRLGTDHPDTLAAELGVGSVLISTSRFAEAESVLRRNLDASRATLGTQHPQTIASMGLLSSALFYEKRYADAESLARQVAAFAQQSYGAGDERTLAADGAVASILLARGQLAQAEEMLRHELQFFTRMHGERYPQSLYTMLNLASCLKRQGRLEEADEILTGCVELRREGFGPEDRTSAYATHSLAALKAMRGFPDEAEKLYRQSLAINLKLLGDEHLETLRDRADLIVLLTRQGRVADAQLLIDRSAAVAERKLLDTKHPDVLWLTTFTDALYTVGRGEAAGPILERASALATDAYGPNDPRTKDIAVACARARGPTTNSTR